MLQNLFSAIARSPYISRWKDDEAISESLMPSKQYYFYIMINNSDTVTYTGVTNDLNRRIYEHKNKLIKGFTDKYNIIKLVYYEIYDSVIDAIAREKQIKGGSRKKKIDLIKKENPKFRDLSLEWE